MYMYCGMTMMSEMSALCIKAATMKLPIEPNDAAVISQSKLPSETASTATVSKYGLPDWRTHEQAVDSAESHTYCLMARCQIATPSASIMRKPKPMEHTK